MLSDVYVMSHDSGEQLHSEIWVRNLNIACVVSDCPKRSRGGKQTSDLRNKSEWINTQFYVECPRPVFFIIFQNQVLVKVKFPLKCQDWKRLDDAM